MSEEFRPTMELRWIHRPTALRHIKVLQQKWVSNKQVNEPSYVGILLIKYKEEWRDVPLVND